MCVCVCVCVGGGGGKHLIRGREGAGLPGGTAYVLAEKENDDELEDMARGIHAVHIMHFF